MTNKKFKSLSKKAKRMAILKDAKKLVEKSLVVIDPCTVLQFGFSDEHYSVVDGEEADLQKVLADRFKKKKPCTVCERGLLLVSTVLNDNRFRCDEVEVGGTFDPKSSTDKRLMEYFSGAQLRLMEDVLMMEPERYLEIFEDLPANEDGFLFALMFPNVTERAVAILENTIMNGGIFKP